MSTNLVLLLLLALGISGVIALCAFATGMNLFIRSVLTLGLLAVLAFCGFGFMATYEYSEASRRLPWQLGYGVLGAVCLLCTVLLWRTHRSASQTKEQPTHDNSSDA